MNWKEDKLKNTLISEEVKIDNIIINFEIKKHFMDNYDLRFVFNNQTTHLKYDDYKNNLFKMCDDINNENSTLRKLIISYLKQLNNKSSYTKKRIVKSKQMRRM